MSRFFPSTVALAVVLSIAGCGGPEVELVTGRVLLDGAPLTDVSVCLWPRSDLRQGMLTAREVGPEGHFEIHARPEIGEERAGDYVALVYEYRRIPRYDVMHYTNPETSPFKVTVNKGVTELEDFRLVDEGRMKRRFAELCKNDPFWMAMFEAGHLPGTKLPGTK